MADVVRPTRGGIPQEVYSRDGEPVYPRAMATYQTIAHAHHAAAITINGSRFLADVRRATSPEDALAEVDSIRQQYPDASHHCWAYRLHTGNLARSSDDGEPGGSAGRPILAQIDGHDLFASSSLSPGTLGEPSSGSAG